MLIVGAGGLAAQLFDDLAVMDFPDIIFWSETDTNYSFIRERYKILKSDAEVTDYFNDNSKHFILCVGTVDGRIKMEHKFKNLGGELTSFISPFSNISEHGVSIGEGTVILRDVDIEPGASIGNLCLVNKQANIGHDCKIASFCDVGPTSLVSAGSSIGERSMIGMGSIILPGITIGCEAIISAGSIVTKKVPDRAVVSGNPAEIRFFRKK
jgi:UDP-perosamine 4-acetyltransferase